jgi:hypothetical protein
LGGELMRGGCLITRTSSENLANRFTASLDVGMSLVLSTVVVGAPPVAVPWAASGCEPAAMFWAVEHAIVGEDGGTSIPSTTCPAVVGAASEAGSRWFPLAASCLGDVAGLASVAGLGSNDMADSS